MLNVDESVARVDNRLKILQCSADSECEVDTRISLKQREDRVSVPECEFCILQQREVRAKCETHVLTAPKGEARILSVPEREARVSTKHEGRVST